MDGGSYDGVSSSHGRQMLSLRFQRIPLFADFGTFGLQLTSQHRQLLARLGIGGNERPGCSRMLRRLPFTELDLLLLPVRQLGIAWEAAEHHDRDDDATQNLHPMHVVGLRR
jgi:hypothetical protein